MPISARLHDQQTVGRMFQRLESDHIRETYWLGTRVMKSPDDLWTFQEIITQTKPDLLIETGTAHGGSALWYATVFDALGRGRVITVDIEDYQRPAHSRIEYLIGSSTAPAVMAQVRSMIHPGDRVMVTLDSDHRAPHVLQELQLYAPLVSPGCYLVVEDTALGTLARNPIFDSNGPNDALALWLADHSEFTADHKVERPLTGSPGGWLRRAIR